MLATSIMAGMKYGLNIVCKWSRRVRKMCVEEVKRDEIRLLRWELL